MLAARRTYRKAHRTVATLLGLSLLFGAGAPLAQTTCAMGQNGQNGQSDLHGTHDCHHENTHSHGPAEAPTPPCPHEAESTQEGAVPSSLDARPCCAFESAATGEAVTLLSRSAWRDAGNLFLALLPPARYEAPDKVSAPARLSAPPRCTGSPRIDRQALLATFLI